MKRTFSSSTPNLEMGLPWQTWLILLLAAIPGVGGYLFASAFTYRLGFPLDDSWIFQTYARNLALRGEWAFLPGQPSGGSTAPLWSALLSLGFRIHLAPYVWTYFVGGLALILLAVEAEFAMRQQVENYRGVIPWAGLLMIFEWHMAWSAVSGMETLLHGLLVLIVLVALSRKPAPWALIGILVGLSVWVRPDGITLLGPVLFTAVFGEKSWGGRIRAIASALVGFGTLFIVYLLFNLLLAGTVLPTTFYAKQAEYISWQQSSILGRIGETVLKFLAGPGLVLLPGFVLASVQAIRKKEWGRISAILWIGGYLLLYVLRLPAYQHGRYIMPAIPIYCFIGLIGFFRAFQYPVRTHGVRLTKSAWAMTIGLFCLGFWLMGARYYVDDVRFIESEMVDTANWVAKNIPPDKLLAVHDIGAMGYFGNHNMVDLAGLISPDVIPFIRDDERIAVYLDEKHVDYLVAFPDWYTSLTSDLLPVFTTGAPYAPALGGTNMTVYLWLGR
jgi:hypothetical protein